jgi:hypothetical protein
MGGKMLKKNQNICLQISSIYEAQKTVYINVAKEQTWKFYFLHPCDRAS